MKDKKSHEKKRSRLGEENKLNENWLKNNKDIISKVSIPKLEKKINEYITLRLEYGRTFIYVVGKKFIQCIRLILNIPKGDVTLYDEVDSIDEAAGLYSKHILQNRIITNDIAPRLTNEPHNITPEQEFWGHCSNIQAWVEHNYDTRILMTNISFPLLRELTKAGDPKAKMVYKEEVALRLESGYPSVVQYLLSQGYIQVFTIEEFQSILDATPIIKNLSTNCGIFFNFLVSCMKYFPDLVEDILLRVLKLPDGKIILISSLNRKNQSFSRKEQFLYYRYGDYYPYILYILRNHLEHLILRYEENLGEDIIDCINHITEQLNKQNIPDIQLSEMMELEDLPLKDQFLAARLMRNTPCSYCGHFIPKGQDICDWCGHKKNDDDDFFPYPYIFKPPDGGGGMRTPLVKLYPNAPKKN